MALLRSLSVLENRDEFDLSGLVLSHTAFGGEDSIPATPTNPKPCVDKVKPRKDKSFGLNWRICIRWMRRLRRLGWPSGARGLALNRGSSAVVDSRAATFKGPRLLELGL